jgi:C1A family cysteine protease
MKVLSSILVLLMGFTTLVGQKKAVRAPMDAQFVQYAKESRKKSLVDADNQYSTGYYPSPVKLNFNEFAFHYDRKKSSGEVSAAYDLLDLDLITSVKDQNPLGSCWTFSSIGAIESRWIQLGGYTKNNLDLSEENMGTCHGFEYGINDGGNDMIAAAYLTRLDGPVTEAADPYSRDPNATCPTGFILIPKYVPTVVWLPKDVNIVKKAIMEYGAVTSSIHVDQDPFTPGGLLSMNRFDHTFYYGGTNPVNHGVLIVGWDDNKSVSGGGASPGSSTGAWIVKNSWGDEWRM